MSTLLPKMTSPIQSREQSFASAAKPFVLLTIAGHDPSSGAGVTADLQTFAAHGYFGTSAITQLTVQSTRGVSVVEPVVPRVLPLVLRDLDADLPLAGIKIGMLGGTELVHSVAQWLNARREEPAGKSMIPVIFDPVLASSSGALFLDAEAVQELRKVLLPEVDYLTPNWNELSALTQLPVENFSQAETALHALGEQYPQLSIVATGGDQQQTTDLLRLPSGEIHRFMGERIESTSTHGTGCAFSSALLCRLVQGQPATLAVLSAKHFVTEAIRRAPGLGKGRGPLNLLWPLQTPYPHP